MDTNAELGTTITLSVAVTGYNLFEWYKDGMPMSDGGRISGVETDTLTITNAMTSDTGSYFVLVSTLGLANAVGSDPAFVRVQCKLTPNLSWGLSSTCYPSLHCRCFLPNTTSGCNSAPWGRYYVLYSTG